jgi:cell fate regulator YaaT (PSP1 superfamily)
MPVLTGVRLRRAGKVYYFDAAGWEDLVVGDRVIVDTVRGREAGWVVIAPGQVLHAGEQIDLKPVLRRATWDDLTAMAQLQLKEPAALEQVRARIAAHNLPMRAVLVEYSCDGSRLTVYFVSEQQRVDFRELVRDLAGALRTRVHLRQIGPRDQAKLIGGIDRCGRELCCATWLPEFQPISIRMAKNQNLPLNPAEISGVCGKLLCCLAFEDDQYADLRTGMPKTGAKLASAAGRGKVVDVNVLTRRITIEWETGTRVEVDADEFRELAERRTPLEGEAQGPRA